jgi:D-beta-D-heptose 7-phosphate kinase/D-beta-D-heptose 1-phosphate adenosyltransferase
MLDFKGKRILVIGDVMEDVFLYGNYTRQSPEANCQVFEIEKQVVSPGGAANAARNIEALGGTVDLVTCCEGITKTRVIVGNQHLVRIDTKGSLCANKQVNLRNYLDYCDAILISDYGKGTFTLLKDQLQDIASDCRIPIVVDPKEKDFSVYGNVTVITPNFKESQEATNLGGQTILIKEGRQGMLLYDTKTVGPFRECPIRIPGHNVCTKEVAGAGDTVSATLALMFA